MLPAAAALGGMAVPALIYAAINHGDPVALRGWAIPAATDIAFAIGIVMLLGSRVPASLKIFLTAVAIIDDLGAIVVIALFYTSQLSLAMLGGAAACLVVLALLNRSGVTRTDAYIVVGLVLWLCVLKSGVHATLAGVATALFIPNRDAKGGSPARGAGARPASVGGVPGAADVRVRQCRRVVDRACSPPTCWRRCPWASRRACWAARRSACSAAAGCW